jgi:hypothetical protein
MKEILIAVISLVAGGLLGPSVNWGIEKKKQKLTYRKELVGKWRDMLADVTKTYLGQQPEYSVPLVEILERHKDFFSLKPHLCSQMREALRKAWDEVGTIEITTINDGTAHINRPDPLISLLVNEVAAIEEAWGLV